MQYDKLANKDVLDKTVSSLKEHGYETYIVKTGQEALSKIKEIIPEKASIINGASTTLEQIGFIEYLKSKNHPWNNLHEAIVNEEDPEKQAKLRRESVLSDYYIGSVHALTENGEFLVASNTGSQLSQIVYTSLNLVFVVSTKKIVPDEESAINRLKTYVVPLENERMMKTLGVGTALNKIVMFRGENKMRGRKIHFILIEEDLGF